MKPSGSQLRRYLFYGLTLVLAAVFVVLAIQGRRMEKKQQTGKPSEIVQNYAPTPIRVLVPRDLLISDRSMVLEHAGSENPLPAARHNLEIQNSGSSTYREVGMKLEYLDARGAVLTVKTQSLKIPIAADNRTSSDITVDSVPPEAVDCRISALYADIEPAKGTGRRE